MWYCVCAVGGGGGGLFLGQEQVYGPQPDKGLSNVFTVV